MTKQYFNKREYLGKKILTYSLQYGKRGYHIQMEWISGEYTIMWARRMDTLEHLENYTDFPYRRTPKVIDRIEELLK